MIFIIDPKYKPTRAPIVLMMGTCNLSTLQHGYPLQRLRCPWPQIKFKAAYHEI